MKNNFVKAVALQILIICLITILFVQPVSATPPEELNFTVDRAYALPGSQTIFGSWASTGILESAGGLYEQFFFSNWNVHVLTVLSDPQGTITIKSQLQNPHPGPNGSLVWTGNWVIVSGSGAYAGLHGQGMLIAEEFYYDSCAENAYGITGPCVMGTETFIGQGHSHP
jgi:hypothetical protein